MNTTTPKATHTDTPHGREARFVTMTAVHALERIAANLEAMRERLNRDPRTSAATLAQQAQLDEAAAELAQHADALAEACGWRAYRDQNLADLIKNPSVR